MFKKISILTLALCSFVLVAKGKSIPSYDVILGNQNDSINYTCGLINGYLIKMRYLRNDSSKIDVAITEFADALQRGYDGKIQTLSDAANIGKQLGISIKESEKKGLANNPAWTLNEKLFFNGLLNGLDNDSSIMTDEFAMEYFQKQYEASALSNDSIVARAAIKSTCPTKAKKIVLKTQNDSLNYAFGLLNGQQIAEYYLNKDDKTKCRKEFIEHINLALKSKVHYPQLVEMGEQMGMTIKAQEPNGLIGEASLTTNFTLIKRGFINGILNVDTNWNNELANEYIHTTMTNIKYGKAIKEGETFLAENAKEEGVMVTESGLQYKVITLGEGPKPTAENNVKVHYHGTLIDGTVFDSSVERGEPITFALTQVIQGWTEGLQLMPVGSKFIFYIPHHLGYGSQHAGSIDPYSTLIFEVELLEIEK
jgi:FKBP-type peptidyl-prolyl cis-trans isomerase FklB